MLDKVKVLHGLRQQQAILNAEIKESRTRWEERNAFTLNTKRDIDAAIAETEAELKTERVRTYNGEDKSKMWGCAIRDVSRLDYMESLAFEWAVTHKLALRLNKPQFEKIARLTPMDFVTITTEPQATIAADLSEYVE